jgi:aryl-alcohol dehydrogenase-like predicted oxidoreductase
LEKLNIFKTKNGSGISRLILGTGGYGSRSDDRFYFDLLDYYISAGGNTLDTAAVYGESERTLGRWLKTCGINRGDIIISTKGAHPPISDIHSSRMTAVDIDYDINNSLRDLACDYIDIYYLHRDNINVPVSYIMDTLNKYVEKGYVRALGASNWSYERISQANTYAASNRLAGFSFSQIYHSLARLTPEEYGDDTLICMNDTEAAGYAASKIPVMAFTSQARGFFFKNYKLSDTEVAGRFATAENRSRLIRLRNICKLKGLTPSEIVLSYLTSAQNPVITLPVIGASSITQLRETVENAGYELTEAEIKYLDGKSDIF